MNFNNIPPNGIGSPPCNLPYALWRQPYPQQQPIPNLPQPPFMPPSCVGSLEPHWNMVRLQPYPTHYDHPEQFPYSPVQYNTEQNHSFPYNPNNQQQRNFNNKRHNSNNSNKQVHAKKAKEENSAFIDYCDVCDRGFKTEEKKQQHYAEHAKCTEPGCSFEAHFKIVKIHKKNLHGANAIRINPTTPEEIAKWREERRKKFPTADRVKEKLAEETSMKISGAVLQDRSFGKFQQRRRGNKFNRGGGGRSNNDPNWHKKEDTRENDNEHVGVTPPLASSANKPECMVSKNPLDILAEAEVENEQKDEIDRTDNNSKTLDPSSGTALTSLSQLMTSYGSDAGDASDEENAEKVSDINNCNADCTVETQDSLTSGEVTKPASRDERNNRKGKFNKRNNRNSKPTPRSRLSRPSLLQMLLEPEMRRERNDILQCVRYIVKNDFFYSTPVHS